MAERKSGPVKPPTIDLTVRPTDPAKTDSMPAVEEEQPAPAAETPETPPDPEPTKPPEPVAAPTPPPAASSRWMPATAGALAGAVVAVAVCYGLAYSGLWPAPSNDASQWQGRLADVEKSEAAGSTAIAGLNTHLSSLEADFNGKLGAASGSLADVQQSLAKLQQQKPASVDLSPLETQVKTLAARLDAVAAGASSADAGALAANLSTVQQSVTGLATKLAALDTRASATDATIANLKDELASAKSAIDQAASAPSPKTIASAMQLPLLISALEADFAAGRPYAADLENLAVALPETHVPAPVSDAAATGLPAPDELARQFEAVMPAIVSARPAGTDSSWQGQMTAWVKGMLALRPQGELTGDGPDALLSQLETAVNRHDFAAATTLLGKLPPPMQQAAGDVATKIKTLAAAGSFVAGLRKTALAPATEAQK